MILIYGEQGEFVKVSSETVGGVLKGLGLYSRRLGNGRRGLLLDKSRQSKAHELSCAYDVLPPVLHHELASRHSIRVSLII